MMEMTVVQGVETLLTLLQTAQNMQAQAAQVAALVRQAQAEGRANFTPSEWATIQQADNNARQQLVDAISRALLK